MKFKKLMAMALTTVMAAGMLTGCGDSAASNTNTNTESKTESKAEATQSGSASSDVVTINVTRATFNLATPDSAQVDKVEAAINDYIKDKINV